MGRRHNCRRSIEAGSNLNFRTLDAIWRVTLVVALLLLMAASHSMLMADSRLKRETVVVSTATNGDVSFNAEIAETSEQKGFGLMFRTSLPDSEGMLFHYDRPMEITMWMKNTYIPLDMLFIRADGVIHRIEARTEPLSERVIASRGNVTAVLEIAGGAAERLQIRPGDRVQHRFFK